jgi:beta-carotene 15,15'-dioxygenase
MQNARFSRFTPGLKLCLALALALATASAWWLDRNQPQAGLAALLVLTLTTGFFHGALDAVILLRQFRPIKSAFTWALVYLVTVLLLGAAFARHTGMALVLLLLLSVWHFGEPFGRGQSASTSSNALNRFVLGGASVLLPALTSARQLDSLSYGWFSLNDQWAWSVWRAVAWAWLALLVFWAWRHARLQWQSSRWTAAEVATIAVLNILLTPLMAFALYFGLYHAPVHIFRVARASNIRRIAISPVTLLTVGTTLALAALLLWWLEPQAMSRWQNPPSLYLQWLVVGLLALTVPHMVLISYSANWLSKARTTSS